MKNKVVTAGTAILLLAVLAGCRNETVPRMETSEESKLTTAEKGSMISEDEASQAAFQHANTIGKEAFEAREISIEEKNGVEQYEVDLFAEDEELEYAIDAYTGDILSWEYEYSGAYVTIETPLSMEEAKNIALSFVQLAREDCVFRSEIFHEAEIPPVYIVSFLHAGQIYKLEIRHDGVVSECSVEPESSLAGNPRRVEK